ncbi:MAG: HAD family hydrolase [Acidobacteriota bacterium]
MKRLLLFDIDGTLVSCGRQVGEIFTDAMTEAFGGYSIPEGFSFSGKTDPMIVTELVRELGFDDAEIQRRLPQMRDRYVVELERRLDVKRMRLLPHVNELLERLAERDDVTLGLLTGNFQAGAWVKLSRFELGRFFPFGAFGDDAEDRRGLVPVARQRAASHARDFAPEETLIIGDTALDVDCAHHAGVPCLAVATGFTSAEVLRDAGADWVFDDLVQASQHFELFSA